MTWILFWICRLDQLVGAVKARRWFTLENVENVFISEVCIILITFRINQQRKVTLSFKQVSNSWST